MSWINKNESMPEKDKEIPWCSVDVLVTNGQLIGIGNYDYDLNSWDYTFPGYYECSNNYITMWQYLPELPKG